KRHSKPPGGFPIVQSDRLNAAMSLFYTVKEGLTGFRRAKLSMAVSITTITVCLILLGLFVILTTNGVHVVQTIRDKVELEVFLEEPVTKKKVEALKDSITSVEGIATVTYLSKEEAARIFKEEFGEDIHDILDYNPLPASFKVQLKDEYKTLESTERVYTELLNFPDIDDVVYHKDLLQFIEKRTKILFAVGIALGFIVSVSAILLVANTIRLAIYSKRKIIQTMKLVGATRMFIRMPFLLEGVFQGMIGGAMASVTIYGLLEAFTRLLALEVTDRLIIAPMFYPMVVVVGILLGLLGSFISIRKFIGESIISS
ncbi:MAG: cell division protein FtsX, partial [Bacteroidota bacterium]